MLLSQHGFVSHSQDACGDDDTDTDSIIFALVDGAGTEVNNQHPVPDSATPGISVHVL